MYAVSKTNNEDNDGLTLGFGNAVVSSVETGELLIFPMRDDSGKMPALRDKPVRPPSNLPRAKTYSTDDIWLTLHVEGLCGGFGEYQAFMRGGNYQSAPYRFKADPGAKAPHVRPFEAVLKAKGHPGKSEFGILGAEFASGPNVTPPEKPGLNLVFGKPLTEHGVRHLPVHGAFRFEGEWPKDAGRLPLHFLVTEKGYKELGVSTLWLPREKCRFHDGVYTGSFNFDLGNLFIAGDGVSKPPPKAWLGVVHRGWQGPITRVEFPAP
jgi:hypothetical protein